MPRRGITVSSITARVKTGTTQHVALYLNLAFQSDVPLISIIPFVTKYSNKFTLIRGRI
jgi:hypothetical protein